MINNPAVNRYLKDNDMDRIDHAIGRPIWPLRETYRNHYATHVNSTLAIDFAFSPHWESLGQQGDMAFFAVTDVGRQALFDHLQTLETGERQRAYVVTYEGYECVVPAKSRAQARYANWLQISDCFAELTFGEFIKSSSVRLAA